MSYDYDIDYYSNKNKNKFTQTPKARNWEESFFTY